MSAVSDSFGLTQAKEQQSHGDAGIPGQSGNLVESVFTKAQESEKDFVPNDEAAVRTVTFWRNGFQFQDGELRLYDDPNQAKILQAINTGSAPAGAMNVLPGQLVELRVIKRIDEDYVLSVGTAKQFLPVKAQKPTLAKPSQGSSSGQQNQQNQQIQSKWNIRSVLHAIGVPVELKKPEI